MGGCEGPGEEAAGEGGQKTPGEGEESEGPAGQLRGSKIEDRGSSENQQNRTIDNADGEKYRPPTRGLSALGGLGAAIDDLFRTHQSHRSRIPIAHLHVLEIFHELERQKG